MAANVSYPLELLEMVQPHLGPDSLYEIGSANKTVTATILADLANRDVVALDDPVANYLPDFVFQPGAASYILGKKSEGCMH